MDELAVKKHGVLSAVQKILSCDYFPIFTAVLSVVNYYMGIDLINIYIYGIVLIAMILLLDDLTPLVTQFLFLAVICSAENSPMYGNSDFYTQTQNFVQIAVIIAVISLAAIYRFIKQARAGKVRITAVFISVILLSVVYILNGMFSDEHGSDDLRYGIILAASLLPLYLLLSCTVTLTPQNTKKLCTGFFIFSVVVVTEVIVALTKLELPIAEWTSSYVRNNALKLGWGMWNNAGMLLVISVAPVLYLSLVKRGGWFYILWGSFLVVAVIATTSRQSYIGVAIAYTLAILYVLVKSRRKKLNYVAFGVVAAVAIAIVIWLFVNGYVEKFIDTVLFNFFNSDGSFTGNGRTQLWERGWQNFLNNPIFGVGFYAENMQTGYTTAMKWFPLFYHNTIFQILGACGGVGMAVYLFHRISSVVAFIKNRSAGTIIIAITMAAYLIMSLFDNHMYYILSGFIYPALLAVVTNPKQKRKKVEVIEKAEEEKKEPAGYVYGRDAFLDGLTCEERAEFFELFIGVKSDELPFDGYVTGGDNREFFKDIFVYLGELPDISDGLMNKIYLYARKSDIK